MGLIVSLMYYFDFAVVESFFLIECKKSKIQPLLFQSHFDDKESIGTQLLLKTVLLVLCCGFRSHGFPKIVHKASMSMVVLKMFMVGGTSILVYYSYATCVSQWLQMSYNAGAVHLILIFPLCLQSTSTNAILIRFRC